MWNRFICWLIGHKTMVKAYVPDTKRMLHPLGYEYDMNYYKWERQKHCLRCGKEVPKEE